MRAKLIPVVGSVLVVIAFAATSATGASKPKSKSANCTYDIASQGSSNPTAPTKDLGYVHCDRPFGNGLQSDTSTGKVNGSHVTITGPVKNYFDNGTVRGTYSLAGLTTGSTFTGSATVTGGTGAYKHIKGSIKSLTCTVKSPTQNHCTGKLSYTLG